ncbi:DUF4333 domain-containing protein [Streptomyces sp. NPDC057486]|uniref:DUF4333 domain-containing protein n=1 Tax=Streptomyces sp. NPDC057486 TaxID=3346145 RepID=UPI00367C92C7
MLISRLSAAASIFSTVAVSVLLTGCSSSGHTEGSTSEPSAPTLSGDRLVAAVADRLSATPEQVTCPRSLVGKVGTKVRCQLKTDDGSAWDVLVTVTSVDGSQVNFGVNATQQ